jgi:hypothetical protein
MSKVFTDGEILDALMTSRTATEAAEKLGCTRETISRRKAEPDFQAMLAEARAARHQALGDGLHVLMDAHLIRARQYLLDDSMVSGMTPSQVARVRLQAMAEVRLVYFGARAAARDEDLRELEERLDSQDRELALLRRLVLGDGRMVNGEVPTIPR